MNGRLLRILLAAFLMLAFLTSCSGGSSSEYIIIEENFGSEYYGIGFRQGDNALTLKVQSLFDEMVSDGTYATISEKWFGKDTSVANAQFPRAIEETGDDSLEYIMNKGKFILGLDETFPPMGFRDGDGNIVGFDIDLATELCKRLGVELVLQPIDWDAKEIELSSKSIDCIWNGMSITDARVQAMNITKPYIANTQVITVAADSGIATKADLAGKKVATQSGSAALSAINDDADFVASVGELVEFKSFDDAYLDLKAGRVDALVIDEVYIRYVLEND